MILGIPNSSEKCFTIWMKLLRSLLAGLKAVCAAFPDSRKGRGGNIAMANFGLSAFAMFFMQSVSFLAFQRVLERGQGRSNCQSLFGIEKIPSDNYIRDMLDDADDLAIVNGVIGLASAFHRKVIAEGVETVAHGTLLLSLGCELAQGYGIARPMPAADIPGWVASWQPDAAWIEISHDLNELTNAIQAN